MASDGRPEGCVQLTALLMTVPIGGGESDVVVAGAEPRDVWARRAARARWRPSGTDRAVGHGRVPLYGPAVDVLPGALAHDIALADDIRVGGGGN
jgi:hypothetical protein